MFDEPNEEPTERSSSPEEQAREKSDEFRMHAELAAVFEATRKFDAQIIPGLDAQVVRDIQRTIGKLEKSRDPASPILPAESVTTAKELLEFPSSHELSTNDYHVSRRPGEVMIVRWLAGDEIETFYERLQAHFDAALEGFKEDERQAREWKKDGDTEAYFAALDKIEIKMADRYLRDPIKQHDLFVLSTQSADEMNISFLTDSIMSVPAEELVGAKSAPGDNPSDTELAWFFKLFSLRGVTDGVERMCFFTFLQKSDDNDW